MQTFTKETLTRPPPTLSLKGPARVGLACQEDIDNIWSASSSVCDEVPAPAELENFIVGDADAEEEPQSPALKKKPLAKLGNSARVCVSGGAAPSTALSTAGLLFLH